MSDENTPKLRLRPKLAGAPPAVTPAPATPPVENAQPEAAGTLPPPTLPEAKPVVLRPKLALKIEEPAKIEETAAAAPPSPPALEPGPYLHDPRAFPAPAAKPLQVSPRPKPSVSPAAAETSPADSGAVPPFPLPANKDKLPAVLNAPPPPRPGSTPAPLETWPAVLNAPPPPGLGAPVKPSGTQEAEPAEITAIRKASTFPFPAPTAKFPPLPGLASAVDTAPQETSEQTGFLKKLLLIGTLVVVLLGAGAYVGFKFLIKAGDKATTPPAVTDKSLATPPAPKAAAPQVAPVPDKVSVAADPVPVSAPPAVVPPSAPPSAAPVAVTSGSPVPTPPPAVVPAPPPQVKAPPPPPSLAFKAWVINLRIRGVRGGDAQRVFIDKTSYVPGDVVNQQLGIIFTGYDEDNRMLTFQDKTGAVFERRH